MNLPTRKGPRPHLLFRLDQSWFVVDASAVREILALPGLIPMAEAPPYVAGVLNLRGSALPVMDLHVRFGAPTRPPRVEDALVVLELDGVLLGVMVTEVADVCSLADADLQPTPNYGTTQVPSAQFVSGMARVPQGLAMQLNLENLFRLPPLTARSAAEADITTAPTPADGPATATAEIFRTRAESYAQLSEVPELATLVPLAVVRLNSEYFAMDLGVVREFADLRNPTPVPCCPPHIIGQMNLRGDLLTVLDLRVVLGLSAAAGDELRKVVTVQWGTFVAGIAVHEVCDVIYLRPADITGGPSAVPNGRDDPLKGAAAYRDRMLSILDVSRILDRADLLVNEEV